MMLNRMMLSLAAVAVIGLLHPTVVSAEQAAHTSTASIETDINYLMYTPDGYEESSETYPLVVWLHGGDQGGSDIEKLKTSGIPKLIEDGKSFPFLVFSPQNPSVELLYPIEKVDAHVRGSSIEIPCRYITGLCHGFQPRRIWGLGNGRAVSTTVCCRRSDSRRWKQTLPQPHE